MRIVFRRLGVRGRRIVGFIGEGSWHLRVKCQFFDDGVWDEDLCVRIFLQSGQDRDGSHHVKLFRQVRNPCAFVVGSFQRGFAP